MGGAATHPRASHREPLAIGTSAHSYRRYAGAWVLPNRVEHQGLLYPARVHSQPFGGRPMRKLFLILMLCAACCASLAAQTKSIYDFTMKSIDGQPVSLGSYSGKVVLLVNVASKCGFTPQYAGLEALYEKYKDRGLVIVGIPANNFAQQEPGTNEEIKKFCSNKYNVTFP